MNNKKNSNNSFQKAIDFAFNFINSFYPIIFCLVCFVITFLCFYNLGEYCVLDWDEARHGISAYEMIKSGNYIQNTYNYQPDYWNLKPVLSFWPIVICFKLFGPSVFSLRFTSAFSMVLLSVFTGIYTRKKFGKAESLATLLTFCSCTPFYMYHCARNGDADSLFILFYSLSVMLATTKKYFPLSGLFLALGFLTKSWHIGSAVLIVIIYFFAAKLYKSLDKKKIILFFVLGLLPIFAWMAVRYSYDGTEFFKRMIEYDLFSRSADTLDNHKGYVMFYFDYLRKTIPSMVISSVILLGCYAFYRFKNKSKFITEKSFTLLLWFGLPFILYSLMSTKLQWYIFSVCVPLCIFCGCMTVRFIKNVKIHSVLKILFTLYFAYFILTGTARFAVRITNPNVDYLQNFMAENITEKNETCAFIEVKYTEEITGSSWSQSALFLAEIYGDYNCIYGGFKAFESSTDSNAVLIAQKEVLKGADLNDYNIIAQDEQFIMLEK